MSAQDLEQWAHEVEWATRSLRELWEQSNKGWEAQGAVKQLESFIVAALRQQPAPVVDDVRMARALEWVRGERRPGGEMVVPDRSILAAIEEAIAAYDPNCGARTVCVVDDGNGVRACSVLIAARAHGVQP